MLKHGDEIISNKNNCKSKMVEKMRAILVEEIDRIQAMGEEKERRLKNELKEDKVKQDQLLSKISILEESESIANMKCKSLEEQILL